MDPLREKVIHNLQPWVSDHLSPSNLQWTVVSVKRTRDHIEGTLGSSIDSANSEWTVLNVKRVATDIGGMTWQVQNIWRFEREESHHRLRL